MEEQDRERGELVRTVEKLRKQIEDKAKEHDRVIGAFHRGLITEEDLVRQLTGIDNEKKSLMAVVSELEQRNLHVDTAQLTKDIQKRLDAYTYDINRGCHKAWICRGISRRSSRCGNHLRMATERIRLSCRKAKRKARLGRVLRLFIDSHYLIRKIFL
jgi:hypothetical protein